MQEKTTNTEMTSMEASSSSSTTRPPQERPYGHSEDVQMKNGSGPSSVLIRSMSFPGANGPGPRLLRTLSTPSPLWELPAFYLSAFPGTVLHLLCDRGDGRIHGNQQEPNDGIQDNSRIHRNQQVEDFPRQSHLPGTVLPNEADRGDGRIHGNQQERKDEIEEVAALLENDYSRIHGNQQEIKEEADHTSVVINSNLQRLFQEIRELKEDDASNLQRILQEIKELQGHRPFADDSEKKCCTPGSYFFWRRCTCTSGCYFCCSVALFISLFLLASLIIYIVSKHQKPVITMKSITFDQFNVSLGSDFAGLKTYMVSVNSTVKFTYRNTETFFRVRVTMSKPLNLNYFELTLATGNMSDFYQSKKSQRTVAVEVSGNQIPMYGAAASFISYEGKPVPLNLSFAVSSRALIQDSLVNSQFDMNIYCSVFFDPKKLKVPLSLHNCTHK